MLFRITAILLSILCILCYSLLMGKWVPDDAFISFRYAENLAGGNGPVYNPGERVEGYTSFLWVLLLAAGKMAGANLIIFSKIMAIIFTFGCIFAMFFAHKFIRNLDPEISAIGVLLVSSSGMFLTWGASGMEISLFAFITLLSALYYIAIKDSRDLRKFITLGVLCGLAILARPEGILVTISSRPGNLKVRHIWHWQF